MQHSVTRLAGNVIKSKCLAGSRTLEYVTLARENVVATPIVPLVMAPRRKDFDLGRDMGGRRLPPASQTLPVWSGDGVASRACMPRHGGTILGRLGRSGRDRCG